MGVERLSQLEFDDPGAVEYLRASPVLERGLGQGEKDRYPDDPDDPGAGARLQGIDCQFDQIGNGRREERCGAGGRECPEKKLPYIG